MVKTLNTSSNYLSMQNKGNCKKTQLETIFYYLQKNIATASMVSQATGIPQKNICRFKKDLEKKGLLVELEKKACKVTGFKAWYLRANASQLAVKPIPTLFDEILT